MARQRRGGGFRPPELRGTLGTLLRTTLAQAGTLRDVLERGAREGRSRLDEALSSRGSDRRRHDALAELGEIVLDLIRRGEIDVDEIPEAHDIVAHLDDLDAGHADEHDEGDVTPPARNRFDARQRDRGDDGTVSSRTWSRPSSGKSAPRVWRPLVDDADDPVRPDDEITAREHPPRRRDDATPPGRSRPTRPATPTTPDRPVARRNADEITDPARSAKRKDPLRKGGIHFDDDDDLAEYMHPDDVPPKSPPDGDS